MIRLTLLQEIAAEEASLDIKLSLIKRIYPLGNFLEPRAVALAVILGRQ